jgi:hypothetical protein
MRMSRYLEARAFCEESKKLKAIGGQLSTSVLERLEQQRSLIPKLRLRYPNPIERRWYAQAHRGMRVSGAKEPNGPRWKAAMTLEKARHRLTGAWHMADPTKSPHPFDRPDAIVRQFLQRPARRKFVPWRDFWVEVGKGAKGPRYHKQTMVTYYSSWQILLFAEVANMGVLHLFNLEVAGTWPSPEDTAAAPGIVSWEPVHAMRDFREHERALDAIVWFAEEAERGYMYATRKDSGRRLLDDGERAEIMRTRLWSAREARRLHKVGYPALLACTEFLCERWAHWEREGRPLVAGAYKSVLAQAVRLTCLAGNIEYTQLRDRVGRAGGYFKPILDVIWTDWRAEQRDDLRRTLISMSRPDALVQAPFTGELIDRFLDFIEENNLHSLYWRMESIHRHAFEGNDHSLEGLKADVQGMAVVLEHIALALGATKQQLRDKFKELWASDTAVMKGLKNNNQMKVGNGTGIDMAWHEARQGQGRVREICADLAISYAIRGGAHRVIDEDNPLTLERMSLILLRAAVSTFETATAGKVKVAAA